MTKVMHVLDAGFGDTENAFAKPSIDLFINYVINNAYLVSTLVVVVIDSQTNFEKK